MSRAVPETCDPPSIPLFNPTLGGNEWTYVKECLDTAWVSSAGAYVERFERQLAERAGVRHAVATSCGTAALHAALRTVGVEADDEVLVSTLTFIASANAIRYCGAWPVLIDAEPRHWQIDPNLVEDFLTNRCLWSAGRWVNRRTRRRVRAIMPVHVLGHPVDLDPILELARRFELLVVEDAAEGVGVSYKGRPVGGLGDVGCLSFNGNKLITTGGGGAILTNDDETARRARHLTTQAKTDAAEYVHDEVGYNYRLTNLQAAVGCAQLEQLADFIADKRATAQAYGDGLRGVAGVERFVPSDDAFCTFWLNTIRVDEAAYGMSCRQLRRRLQAKRIESRPLWQPMHQSPAHREAESVLSGVADRLYSECLSLPSSVGLAPSATARVCEEIRRAAAISLPIPQAENAA